MKMPTTPSQAFLSGLPGRGDQQLKMVDGDPVPLDRLPQDSVLIFSGPVAPSPELRRFTYLDLSSGHVQAFDPELRRWLEGLYRVFQESGGNGAEFGHYFQFWQIYGAARAPATVALVALNVVMFLVTAMSGSSNLAMVRFGASNPMLIREGEWWRVVGATFLHFDVTHILVNMIALWVLGRQVERFYGTGPFLALYGLSGVVGSLASFFFSADNVLSAGASGAIFGLFGAAGLLSFKRDLPRAIALSMRKNTMINLGLNVLVALSVPNLGHAAHLGGLLMGALFAAVVPTATRGPRPKALVRGLAGVGLAYLLVELIVLYHAFQ